jgi:hypothetical protein
MGPRDKAAVNGSAIAPLGIRPGKSPGGVDTAMTPPFSMADMIGLTPVESQV